jgi:hypothetical protein
VFGNHSIRRKHLQIIICNSTVFYVTFGWNSMIFRKTWPRYIIHCVRRFGHHFAEFGAHLNSTTLHTQRGKSQVVFLYFSSLPAIASATVLVFYNNQCIDLKRKRKRYIGHYLVFVLRTIYFRLRIYKK